MDHYIVDGNLVVLFLEDKKKERLLTNVKAMAGGSQERRPNNFPRLIDYLGRICRSLTDCYRVLERICGWSLDYLLCDASISFVQH